MDYRWNHKAIAGLITNGRGTSNPPYYWFFGMFDDDHYELCAETCLQQDGCEAFTFYFSARDNAWANQCYGIGSHHVMDYGGQHIVSGVKVCSGKKLSVS